MRGTIVDELLIDNNSGIIYFIENYNEGIPNPGQYGSNESISTIKELREKLAVKEAWKKTENEPTLRAYRVIAEAKLRSREGIIGPQIEVGGVELPGGGHQYEIIDYLGEENWTNYLEIVGDRKGIKLQQ